MVFFRQYTSSIKRIYIEKRRNPAVTCCESFSHLILFLFLVAGYSLSKITNYTNQNYAQVKLQFPPTVLQGQVLNTSLSIANSLELIKSILSGPLPIPNLDEYLLLVDFLSNQRELSSNLITSTSFGQKFSNLLYKGDLHFAPAGNEVNELIDYLNTTYTSFNTLTIHIHASEDSGVSYILDNLDHPAFAFIVLRQISPEKVNYVIRQNYTVLPNTNQIIDSTSVGLNTEYQNYFVSGFLTLQRSVDEWAFQYTLANKGSDGVCSSSPANAVTIPLPTPSYSNNPFYSQVGFLFGLAITMASLYPVSRTVKTIVEEKEIKMKELMKIMGLTSFSYLMAWAFVSFVLFFWISISETFITVISFLNNSNKGIIFAFFFLFAMSEITFSFLISVFFSNSKLASIVAPVLLFSSILPRFIFFTSNSDEAASQKYAASLLSPTALSFGADIIIAYENAGVGVQFSNINDGKYSFSSALSLMFVDFILYGILAWYFDLVLPQEYGTPEHPLFFLNYKYWIRAFNDLCVGLRIFSSNRGLVTAESIRSLLQNEGYRNGVLEYNGGNDKIENLDENNKSNVRVLVSNLRKRFSDGKVAVKSISCAMVEGQITCLLGSNGAGKTTTISMLTGLVQPTSGNASIYGFDLYKELHDIRLLTGVCPQQNVLFPSLTVTEHLRHFGSIKGLYGKKLLDAVESCITEVGLTEKRYALSKTLSGGQKRKLSLAIALIGDPKFVLLDEPTSGMDPYSRRATWEILQKNKAGRVVVLTTHFMDEADTLADRIMIMSEGKLNCSGSSLFLKSRFGAGYMLALSVNTHKQNPDVITNPISSLQEDFVSPQDISPHKAIELVQHAVPEASVRSHIAGEMILQLPITSLSSFAKLFQLLREEGKSVGITGYGISITSLEQVFIRLAEEAEQIRYLHEHHIDQENDDYEEDIEPSLLYSWFLATLKVVASVAERARLYLFNASQGPQAIIPVGITYNSAANDNDPSEMKERQIELNTINANARIVPAEESHVLISTPLQDTNNSSVEKTRHTWISFLTESLIAIQLTQLLRKRIITSSRDLKGFFFQVVFPAVQILLVLAILTIRVNPAGQTIRLKLSTFSQKAQPSITPLVVFQSNGANPGLSASFAATTSLDSYKLSVPKQTTSYNLSEYYLDNYDSAPENRYGAEFFNDKIPVNVTIDWVYIKENSKIIEDAVNSFLQVSRLNSTELFNDITLPLPTLSASSLSGPLDVLSNALNISAIRNLTIPATIPSGSTARIKSSKVTYESSTRSFIFSNSELIITVNQSTTTIPISQSFTITLDQIINAAPNSTVNYVFDVNSPYTVMHNASSPHAVAFYHGQLIGSIFRVCSPANAEISQGRTYRQSGSRMLRQRNERRKLGENSGGLPLYLVKNHPLPLTESQTLEIRVILALFASIFILVPLCYIPSIFCVFIVQERTSKCKHLQVVSGVSPILYWVATYVWDLFIYTILFCFILIAFEIYGRSSAVVFIGSSQSLSATCLLLMTYGASSIALSYLYSLFFENYSTAQISILAIHFGTGFVFVLAYYIMISIPETKEFGESIVHFFRFFPPYNVGEGLINLSATYFVNNIQGGNVSYLAWTVTGRNIVFMIVEAVGYFSAMLLLEAAWITGLAQWLLEFRSRFLPPPPPRDGPEDDDVTAEAQKVASSPQGTFMLYAKNVVKTYPTSLFGSAPKHALRGVSIGISEGECFGLLGINGAGKTSLLNILTGDTQQTSGDIAILDRSLRDPNSIGLLGYCPQVDPLLDLLTGREVLWFFGRIRGLAPDVLGPRIDSLINQVGLSVFADRICGRYSGGNKRKLSLAIALVGDPKVLLLDEPSTGMDPQARRKMWSAIQEVSKGRAVVLVSHSMEECEALCTRISILVSGRAQCTGSSQHLKAKFGTGYLIEIQVNRSEPNEGFVQVRDETNCEISIPMPLSRCLDLCRSVLPVCEVLESHVTFIKIKAEAKNPLEPLDLATLFATLEERKAELGIVAYSVAQAPLEQVFLRFARAQEEERGSQDREHHLIAASI